MGSATSSCFHNVGKLGTTKAVEKISSRDPGYIWITSLATTVEKHVIILGTVTSQLKPSSKRMQRHSWRWSIINLTISPLVEDTRKHWWMSKTLYSVSLWEPHGLMFCHTSTQEVPQTEPINNSLKKGNSSIIHVGDTILVVAAETGIDENWCLLDNKSTWNVFINKKYFSNIRYVPDGQYIRVHCNPEWHTPKQLVTSQNIPILYGKTPREYLTSCPSSCSRNINLWLTTANMEMSLSSTSHSGQHLRWPSLVCFLIILVTS